MQVRAVFYLCKGKEVLQGEFEFLIRVHRENVDEGKGGILSLLGAWGQGLGHEDVMLISHSLVSMSDTICNSVTLEQSSHIVSREMYKSSRDVLQVCLHFLYIIVKEFKVKSWVYLDEARHMFLLGYQKLSLMKNWENKLSYCRVKLKRIKFGL